MKPLYWLLGLLVVFGIVVAWEWPSNQAQVIMCDIGQGDAFLMTQGFSQVLVDTGNQPSKILSCLSKHMPFWDRRLEMVVLTHPDIDHIGAIAEIMQSYAINNLLVSPVDSDTDAFKNIYHTIANSSFTVTIGSQHQEFAWRDSRIKVLWPPPQAQSIWSNIYTNTDQSISNIKYDLVANISEGNTNDASVVLLMEVESTKLLFTGDISSTVELALVEQGVIEDIDILKVAHHGSKYSSEELFLETSKPELAMISVGSKNRYNHPHYSVISRLEKENIPYRRTDTDGSVQLFLTKVGIKEENYSFLPDWLSIWLGLVGDLRN